MEEIRETTKAYYNNFTEEKKSEAKKMFVSMDLNGDGSVSMSEYVKVMGEKGFKSCSNATFFEKLNKYGDGMQDFEEFMSFTMFTRVIGWSFATAMDIELFSTEFTSLASTVSRNHHRCLSIYALLASATRAIAMSIPQSWIIICCFVAWKPPIRSKTREAGQVVEGAADLADEKNRESMEEIYETAKAYYSNLTEEQKSKAKEMFLSMDLNKDERVSACEYVKVMEEKGFKSCSNETFFRELDKDGDGMLDFEEFMSLYYLYRSNRLIFCDGHGCRAFLKGVYFTCADCFKKPSNSFDLCSSCFSNKNYSHKHSAILDNYMLLRSMEGSNKNIKMEQVLETGLAIGDLAELACNCSIM